MTPLLPSQLAALRALLDRLIPADEFPGALDAGVVDYVLRQIDASGGGPCARDAAALGLGLSQLDVEAAARQGGRNFSALDAATQDALLTKIEAGHTATDWPAEISSAGFFARMVDLAHEGFYADPANGGNRDGVSWKMLRYDPRLPARPSAP